MADQTIRFRFATSGDAESANAIKAMNQAFKDLKEQSKAAGAETGKFGGILSGIMVGGGIKIFDILSRGVKDVAMSLPNLTVSLARHADALEDTALKAGISTTALQEFGVAEAVMGMQSGTSAQAITRLSRAITEGSDDVKVGIAEMGMSFETVRQMSPEQQYQAMISGLHGIRDAGEQARMTFQLFGRNTEVLKAVRGDLEGLRKSAHDYNLVMGEQTVGAAANLSDKLDVLGLAWTRLKESFAEGIATNPAVAQSVDDLARSIGQFATVTARASQDAAPAIASIIEKLADLITKEKELADTGAKVGLGMWKGLFTGNLEAVVGGGTPTTTAPSAQGMPISDQEAGIAVAPKKAAVNTKEYTQAVLGLQKAKLAMLPVLDQEHGATQAQIAALRLDAEQKVKELALNPSLADSKGKLNASGQKLAGVYYATANATIKATQAAADLKERLDRLQTSISDQNALAAAADSMRDSYEASVDAIKRETDAQVRLFEVTHNMTSAANQMHVAQLNAISDMRLVAAAREQARTHISQELSDQAEMHQALLARSSDYEQQKVALEDAAREAEHEASSTDHETAARGRAHLALIRQKQETLDLTEAQRRQIETVNSLGGVLGQLSGFLDAVGLGGSRAAKSLGDLGNVATNAGGFMKTLANPNANILDKVGAGINLAGSVGKALAGLIGGTEAEHVNDMRDAFVAEAGGIDTLAQAAAEAGVDLSAFQAAATEADWKTASENLSKTMETARKNLAKTKEDMLKSAGGYEVFAARVKEAGFDITALNGALAATNPENYNNVMALLTGTISAQDEAYRVADEAAKKYGLTVSELGPQWAKADLDKQAADLLKEWSALTARGADVEAVNKKMAVSVQDYVTQALTAGVTVPESMRAMLSSMVDAGTLTDAAGNKLKDLSGINFAADMGAQFKELMVGIRDLVDSLRGIVPAAHDAGIAISSIPNAPGGGWSGGPATVAADSAAQNSMAVRNQYGGGAQVQSLATGGTLLSDGLVYGHAGEMVGRPQALAAAGVGGMDDAAVGQIVDLLSQLVSLQAAANAQGRAPITLNGTALWAEGADALARNEGGFASAVRKVAI